MRRKIYGLLMALVLTVSCFGCAKETSSTSVVDSEAKESTEENIPTSEENTTTSEKITESPDEEVTEPSREDGTKPTQKPTEAPTEQEEIIISEKEKEALDLELVDKVQLAVWRAHNYPDEVSSGSWDIDGIKTGVLLTDIIGISDNTFARLVDKYLGGKNPNDELTSISATEGAFYVKIVDDIVMVWIGKGQNGETVCMTGVDLDMDGNPISYKNDGERIEIEASNEGKDLMVLLELRSPIHWCTSEDAAYVSIDEIDGIETGVLLTDILNTSDNEFARRLNEFLEGKNPNDELQSSVTSEGAIYIKISKKDSKLELWVGKGQDGSSVCETAIMVDQYGHTIPFLESYFL